MRTRNLEELENAFPLLGKCVEIKKCLVRVDKLRTHQISRGVFNSVNMRVVGRRTPTRSEVFLTTIKCDIIKSSINVPGIACKPNDITLWCEQ
jgi:hypothetical protein